MAIIWCGGEDIDFVSGLLTGWTLNTTATYYESAYSRCAIRCATASQNPMLGVPFEGGAVTSFWLTYYVYPYGNGLNLVHCGLASSGGSNGAAGFYVGMGTVAGRVAVYSSNGTAGNGTRITESTTAPLTASALHRVDVHVTGYNSGASGAVSVWVDGTLAIDNYVGTLNGTSGVSSLDRFAIYGSASASYYWYVSEVIVADEDTTQMHLATLAPDGAGGNTQWTGAYSDINEVTPNDATLIYNNTNGQDGSFSIGALTAGTFAIKAVDVSARALKTVDSAVGKIGLGVRRSGSTNSDAGQTVGTAWGHYKRLMNTNPLTTSAWSQSEIDDLEINFRAIT